MCFISQCRQHCVMSKMKSTEQDVFFLLSLCKITMEGCSYAEHTDRNSKLHDGYSTLHLPIFNNKKRNLFPEMTLLNLEQINLTLSLNVLMSKPNGQT